MRVLVDVTESTLALPPRVLLCIGDPGSDEISIFDAAVPSGQRAATAPPVWTFPVLALEVWATVGDAPETQRDLLVLGVQEQLSSAAARCTFRTAPGQAHQVEQAIASAILLVARDVRAGVDDHLQAGAAERDSTDPETLSDSDAAVSSPASSSSSRSSLSPSSLSDGGSAAPSPTSAVSRSGASAPLEGPRSSTGEFKAQSYTPRRVSWGPLQPSVVPASPAVHVVQPSCATFTVPPSDGGSQTGGVAAARRDAPTPPTRVRHPACVTSTVVASPGVASTLGTDARIGQQPEEGEDDEAMENGQQQERGQQGGRANELVAAAEEGGQQEQLASRATVVLATTAATPSPGPAFAAARRAIKQSLGLSPVVACPPADGVRDASPPTAITVLSPGLSPILAAQSPRQGAAPRGSARMPPRTPLPRAVRALAGNTTKGVSTPPPELAGGRILAAVTPTPRQFRTRIGAFTDVRFDPVKLGCGARAATTADSMSRAEATYQALLTLQFAPVVRSAVRSIGCRVVGFATKAIEKSATATAVAQPGAAGWDETGALPPSVLQDMVSIGDVVVAIDGEDVHFRCVGSSRYLLFLLHAGLLVVLTLACCSLAHSPFAQIMDRLGLGQRSLAGGTNVSCVRFKNVSPLDTPARAALGLAPPMEAAAERSSAFERSTTGVPARHIGELSSLSERLVEERLKMFARGSEHLAGAIESVGSAGAPADSPADERLLQDGRVFEPPSDSEDLRAQLSVLMGTHEEWALRWRSEKRALEEQLCAAGRATARSEASVSNLRKAVAASTAAASVAEERASCLAAAAAMEKRDWNRERGTLRSRLEDVDMNRARAEEELVALRREVAVERGRADHAETLALAAETEAEHISAAAVDISQAVLQEDQSRAALDDSTSSIVTLAEESVPAAITVPLTPARDSSTRGEGASSSTPSVIISARAALEAKLEQLQSQRRLRLGSTPMRVAGGWTASSASDAPDDAEPPPSVMSHTLSTVELGEIASTRPSDAAMQLGALQQKVDCAVAELDEQRHAAERAGASEAAARTTLAQELSAVRVLSGGQDHLQNIPTLDSGARSFGDTPALRTLATELVDRLRVARGAWTVERAELQRELATMHAKMSEQATFCHEADARAGTLVAELAAQRAENRTMMAAKNAESEQDRLRIREQCAKLARGLERAQDAERNALAAAGDMRRQNELLQAQLHLHDQQGGVAHAPLPAKPDAALSNTSVQPVCALAVESSAEGVENPFYSEESQAELDTLRAELCQLYEDHITQREMLEAAATQASQVAAAACAEQAHLQQELEGLRSSPPRSVPSPASPPQRATQLEQGDGSVEGSDTEEDECEDGEPAPGCPRSSSGVEARLSAALASAAQSSADAEAVEASTNSLSSSTEQERRAWDAERLELERRVLEAPAEALQCKAAAQHAHNIACSNLAEWRQEADSQRRSLEAQLQATLEKQAADVAEVEGEACALAAQLEAERAEHLEAMDALKAELVAIVHDSSAESPSHAREFGSESTVSDRAVAHNRLKDLSRQLLDERQKWEAERSLLRGRIDELMAHAQRDGAAVHAALVAAAHDLKVLEERRESERAELRARLRQVSSLVATEGVALRERRVAAEQAVDKARDDAEREREQLRSSLSDATRESTVDIPRLRGEVCAMEARVSKQRQQWTSERTALEEELLNTRAANASEQAALESSLAQLSRQLLEEQSAVHHDAGRARSAGSAERSTSAAVNSRLRGSIVVTKARLQQLKQCVQVRMQNVSEASRSGANAADPNGALENIDGVLEEVEHELILFDKTGLTGGTLLRTRLNDAQYALAALRSAANGDSSPKAAKEDEHVVAEVEQELVITQQVLQAEHDTWARARAALQKRLDVAAGSSSKGGTSIANEGTQSAPMGNDSSECCSETGDQDKPILLAILQRELASTHQQRAVELRTREAERLALETAIAAAEASADASLAELREELEQVELSLSDDREAAAAERVRLEQVRDQVSATMRDKRVVMQRELVQLYEQLQVEQTQFELEHEELRGQISAIRGADGADAPLSTDGEGVTQTSLAQAHSEAEAELSRLHESATQERQSLEQELCNAEDEALAHAAECQRAIASTIEQMEAAARSWSDDRLELEQRLVRTRQEGLEFSAEAQHSLGMLREECGQRQQDEDEARAAATRRLAEAEAERDRSTALLTTRLATARSSAATEEEQFMSQVAALQEMLRGVECSSREDMAKMNSELTDLRKAVGDTKRTHQDHLRQLTERVAAARTSALGARSELERQRQAAVQKRAEVERVCAAEKEAAEADARVAEQSANPCSNSEVAASLAALRGEIEAVNSARAQTERAWATERAVLQQRIAAARVRTAMDAGTEEAQQAKKAAQTELDQLQSVVDEQRKEMEEEVHGEEEAASNALVGAAAEKAKLALDVLRLRREWELERAQLKNASAAKVQEMKQAESDAQREAAGMRGELNEAQRAWVSEHGMLQNRLDAVVKDGEDHLATLQLELSRLRQVCEAERGSRDDERAKLTAQATTAERAASRACSVLVAEMDAERAALQEDEASWERELASLQQRAEATAANAADAEQADLPEDLEDSNAARGDDTHRSLGAIQMVLRKLRGRRAQQQEERAFERAVLEQQLREAVARTTAEEAAAREELQQQTAEQETEDGRWAEECSTLQAQLETTTTQNHSTVAQLRSRLRMKKTEGEDQLARHGEAMSELASELERVRMHSEEQATLLEAELSSRKDALCRTVDSHKQAEAGVRGEIEAATRQAEELSTALRTELGDMGDQLRSEQVCNLARCLNPWQPHTHPPTHTSMYCTRTSTSRCLGASRRRALKRTCALHPQTAAASALRLCLSCRCVAEQHTVHLHLASVTFLTAL